MNHEAVYRTAPATPGLLIMYTFKVNAFRNSQLQIKKKKCIIFFEAGNCQDKKFIRKAVLYKHPIKLLNLLVLSYYYMVITYKFNQLFVNCQLLLATCYIVQFSGSKSDKQAVLAQCISISVTTSNIQRLPAAKFLQDNNTEHNILYC